MSWSDPTLITFFIYIILMVLIGFAAYRSTKNFSDYILGGRRLGSLVTALSVGASGMSGWLLMSLPGTVFTKGISAAWIVVGLVIGSYVNWTLVAGRLRVHTEFNGNALTLPDYFANRFEDRSSILRVISALVILIFFTIYCASGIVAAAKLFTSTFQMSYAEALWWGAGSTILYTFVGGFLAVSWTDTVQASLMVFALILAPIVMVLHSGGVMDTVAIIQTQGAHYTQFIGNVSFAGLISFLAWGLGYFGQPHILARFMAASSVHAIPNARRISMAWLVFCLVGAVSVGFFGIAYLTIPSGAQAAQLLDGNSEKIFIVASQTLFNPWMAGVLLSAILAAVMSTLSCQLLVCSSALTEDLYKPYLRPGASQKELVWVGRLMVLVVSLVAIYMATDPDSKVLGLVAYAWAGFGAAFGPLVIFSVFWRRTSWAGAIAGMVVGAGVVLIWEQTPFLKESGLYSLVPGFIASSLAIYTISLIAKPASTKMIEHFDEVSNKYKELTS